MSEKKRQKKDGENKNKKNERMREATPGDKELNPTSESNSKRNPNYS